jgi:hypothetical protein
MTQALKCGDLPIIPMKLSVILRELAGRLESCDSDYNVTSDCSVDLDKDETLRGVRIVVGTKL